MIFLSNFILTTFRLAKNKSSKNTPGTYEKSHLLPMLNEVWQHCGPLGNKTLEQMFHCGYLCCHNSVVHPVKYPERENYNRRDA